MRFSTKREQAEVNLMHALSMLNTVQRLLTATDISFANNVVFGNFCGANLSNKMSIELAMKAYNKIKKRRKKV